MTSGAHKFFAGAARQEITPPIGTPLSGFIARIGVSTGVVHPLFARALVLSNGRTACVIVQLDLLGVAKWHVEEVRQRCVAELNIPAQNVLISASHTHSGPGLISLRGCEIASLSYQQEVVNSSWQVIKDAYRALSPARIFAARTRFRLGINRRRPTPSGIVLEPAPRKPAPKMLDILEIRMRNGRSCLLFSHACHPYVLGGDQNLISGDFPAAACGRLEAGNEIISMFLNGCAGDIAPLRAFQGPVAANEDGERLATAVRSGLRRAQELESRPILAKSKAVYLPYCKLPDISGLKVMVTREDCTVRPQERVDKEVADKIRRAVGEWATGLAKVIEGTSSLEPVYAEIQVLRVGDFCVVGISGEPFFSIGQRISRLSPIRNTWVLGYCNAYSGYHVTSTALKEGGYEVSEAYRYLGMWQLDSSCEGRIVAAAGKLLKQINARR